MTETKRRRKIMKRQAALLSAATMAMSMFAGMPTAAMADKSDVVTINWYRQAWHSNEDEKVVEAAINEYIEPLIGVNVNVLNASETTELSLALAAGDDVDLWWEASWSQMNNLIAGNSAYDLTEVIDDYPALKESIPETVWDACKQNGKLWYIPIYKESGSGTGVCVPTSVVEKYGWDMSTVKSTKDIEPMLEDLKNDGIEYPFVINNDNFVGHNKDEFATLATLSTSKPIAVVRRDDPTKVLSIFEVPEYQEYLEMVHRWFDNGYINESEATAGHGMTAADFETGQFAFSGWSMVPDSEANASNRYGTDIQVIQTSKIYAETDSAAGSVYMVNGKTEKLDAVMKFVELLNTDQTLADLAVYGIEGKHYNLVDGRVEMIEGSGYSYPGAWIVCNVTTPTLMVGESENKAEEYDNFNKNMEISVSNGFRYNNANVQAEVTALEGVMAEYAPLMDRGVYDPEEYFSVYKDAMEGAGLGTVIEDIQAQWDKFLAQQEEEVETEEVETEVESTTAE